MHFPRAYNEEHFIAKEQEERWPLDKHGAYIFPEDRILANSAYFKVVGTSREVVEEDPYLGLIRYRWFVECQDHKPYCVYKFPADICVNCSEEKVYPPFSYVDEVKERASFLCGRGYTFTNQGFKKSIRVMTH